MGVAESAAVARAERNAAVAAQASVTRRKKNRADMNCSRQCERTMRECMYAGQDRSGMWKWAITIFTKEITILTSAKKIIGLSNIPIIAFVFVYTFDL